MKTHTELVMVTSETDKAYAERLMPETVDVFEAKELRALRWKCPTMLPPTDWREKNADL